MGRGVRFGVSQALHKDAAWKCEAGCPRELGSANRRAVGSSKVPRSLSSRQRAEFEEKRAWPWGTSVYKVQKQFPQALYSD